jgi:CheY-like chemotaxis protein
MTNTEALNIFLIDDNDIDIVVNTKLLKLANIADSIHSFNTCDEGFNFIQTNLVELEKGNNVLLLDIQMPNIDGFECLVKFQDFNQSFKEKCKVFMLSSSIDRNDIERAEMNPTILKVYLLKRIISQ